MLKKKLGINAIERDWSFFEVTTVKVNYYFKTSPTLVIPEGCERIGWNAFRGCWRLKKVIIPESVKEIGDYAFEWCPKATIILKKPEKDFEKIGGNAFSGCEELREVVGKKVRGKSWRERLALFWNNIFKKIC